MSIVDNLENAAKDALGGAGQAIAEAAKGVENAGRDAFHNVVNGLETEVKTTVQAATDVAHGASAAAHDVAQGVHEGHVLTGLAKAHQDLAAGGGKALDDAWKGAARSAGQMAMGARESVRDLGKAAGHAFDRSVDGASRAVTDVAGRKAGDRVKRAAEGAAAPVRFEAGLAFGAAQGVAEGAGAMVRGTGDLIVGSVRTGTDAQYRDKLVAKAKQTLGTLGHLAAAAVHDPGRMLNVAEAAAAGEVKKLEDGAIAAQGNGTLGEYAGHIGGRTFFEVASALYAPGKAGEAANVAEHAGEWASDAERAARAASGADHAVDIADVTGRKMAEPGAAEGAADAVKTVGGSAGGPGGPLRDAEKAAAAAQDAGLAKATALGEGGQSVTKNVADIKMFLHEFPHPSATPDYLAKAMSSLDAASGHEVDTALRGLGDADLNQFASRLNNAKFFGVSEARKEEFLHNLSEKAGGTELGRLAPGLDDAGSAKLADLMATTRDAPTRLEFIKGLAPSLDREGPRASLRQRWQRPDVDTAAQRSAATVLSSLDEAGVQAGVKALTDDQLSKVMTAALDTQHPANFAAVPRRWQIDRATHDPAKVLSFVDKAGASADFSVKSKVFRAAASTLQTVQHGTYWLKNPETAGRSARAVADSMLKVLNSDPAKVVDRLNTDDVGGQALTTLIQHLIKDDKAEQLHACLDALHGATAEPGKYASPAAYIAEKTVGPGGGPVYRHAENLGYFSGAVDAAASRIMADHWVPKDRTLQKTTAVLYAVNAMITGVNPAWKAGVPIMNAGIRLTTEASKAKLYKKELDLRDVLLKRALPADEAGERLRGEADIVLNAVHERVARRGI